jgi:hypothetical protein
VRGGAGGWVAAPQVLRRQEMRVYSMEYQKGDQQPGAELLATAITLPSGSA